MKIKITIEVDGQTLTRDINVDEKDLGTTQYYIAKNSTEIAEQLINKEEPKF